MSIDTYFCFCCMSTNDLSNIFSDNIGDNYAEMIKDLCSLSPDEKDYEDDGYICKECINQLGNAVAFKNLVFDTLNVLQGNGLITLYKVNNTILVKKVTDENDTKDEIKYTAVEITELDPGLEKVEDNHTPVKVEPPDNQESPRERDTQIILKNEKKITVAKKRKREALLPKQNEPSYKVTEDLICKICSEEQPNVKVFHSHMNRHYPNHICETCGKGFLTEKRLKRHKPSHDKGPFSCTQCEAIFTNYNTYNSHRQRKHSSVLLYKCPQCRERFATFTRRARHLANAHAHRSDKYHCPACPLTFLVSGNLSSHIRNTHKKTARYRCTECGAGYYHKQELRGHMSSHTGLHLYPCTLCSKSYPRKNALEVHMRTHTGDKRFGCDTCGKRFTQKCTLTKHYKMHLRTQEAKSDVPKELLPTLVIGVDAESLNYVLS